MIAKKRKRAPLGARFGCATNAVQLLPQDKLRPAPRRDPDPIRVVAPGAVQDARGIAHLADDGDAHARIRRAHRALAVLRLAYHAPRLRRDARRQHPSLAHRELPAAAAADPDAVRVVAPRAVEEA